MQDLDLALRLNETSLRAWIHKGKAHVQLGQYADAVQSFQQAIKLHPDQRKVVQGTNGRVGPSRDGPVAGRAGSIGS